MVGNIRVRTPVILALPGGRSITENSRIAWAIQQSFVLKIKQMNKQQNSKAEDVVQWVEYLPSPEFDPQHWTVVHVISRVQGHPWLYNKFKGNLGKYMRTLPKTSKNKKTKNAKINRQIKWWAGNSQTAGNNPGIH